MTMSQTLKFTIKGLNTFQNDVSQIPDGALSVANNIDLSKPGLATPRRGFNNHSTLPTASDRAHSLFSYSDTLFAHLNGTTLYGYIASAWTSKGSIAKPTNAKAIRAVAASKCLFFNV